LSDSIFTKLLDFVTWPFSASRPFHLHISKLTKHLRDLKWLFIWYFYNKKEKKKSFSELLVCEHQAVSKKWNVFLTLLFNNVIIRLLFLCYIKIVWTITVTFAVLIYINCYVILSHSIVSLKTDKYCGFFSSTCIYHIRQFDVEYGWIFLQVMLYFDEPLGESKYKLTSKNIWPYSTSNYLISDLLSNEFKMYTKEEKFRKKT